MRCPGQDRRYWKEDAAFEAPCPECGAAVEIFKDEGSGRCPGCGHRFRNPKTAFDCAQWCEYAEQCVGVAPQQQPTSASTEGVVAGRLIKALKEELGEDQHGLGQALRVYRHANELAWKEGGDPRIVLAAAVLLYIDPPQPQRTPQSPGQMTTIPPGLPKTRRILQDVGLDASSIEQVCRIIHGYRTHTEVDTIESRIVCDCHTLAGLTAEGPGGTSDVADDAVVDTLKTASAKAKARSLLKARHSR